MSSPNLKPYTSVFSAALADYQAKLDGQLASKQAKTEPTGAVPPTPLKPPAPGCPSYSDLKNGKGYYLEVPSSPFNLERIELWFYPDVLAVAITPDTWASVKRDPGLC